MDRKLIDATRVIEVLEKGIEELPRENDYDEGFIAGLAHIKMVLRLMPDEGGEVDG